MPEAEVPLYLQDKLEDFQCQYGDGRGRLALAMDLLADAEIAAGQLGLYCRDGMSRGRPHPDRVQLQQLLGVVRLLVRDAFRAPGKSAPAPGDA
jgi:hypothetical protein